ncbi:MAG: hypothetical protein F4164_08890 [Gemmatimonadales bacterium]|nr:hypothetical protein [Gemmatimonadales bacterium]MYG49464.1 hypothetical protein [Gemmatimonadales bacterium]MYK02016.1 hypothetical protein [Candidatus Palauibacter ramosifaciens]
MGSIRRIATTLTLLFATSLSLSGQVAPDLCTQGCHDQGMDEYNATRTRLQAIGNRLTDEAIEIMATSAGSRVFWGCLEDECGLQ